MMSQLCILAACCQWRACRTLPKSIPLATVRSHSQLLWSAHDAPVISGLLKSFTNSSATSL